MSRFELLKRTYPTSQFERLCDGFRYIIDNSSPEERVELGIVDDELQKVIKINEKYIYQAAKEDGVFKTKSICFKNLAIIQEKMFRFVENK